MLKIIVLFATLVLALLGHQGDREKLRFGSSPGSPGWQASPSGKEESMKRFLISMALAAMLTASVAGGVSANEDEREHALFGRCAALLAQNLEPAR